MFIIHFDRKHKQTLCEDEIYDKAANAKRAQKQNKAKLKQPNNEWGQCGKWIFTFLTIFTTMIHHKNIKYWKHDSLQTPNTASYLLRASLLYKCSFLCSTTCCILGLLEKLSLLISSYLDLAVSETSLNYNYPVSIFPTRQTVFDNETMAWSFHRDGKPARTNFTLPSSTSALITSHWCVQSHQTLTQI